MLCVVLLPGCDGCRSETDDDPAATPLRPIESKPVRVQPADSSNPGNNFKAGHWGVASLELQANLEDLRGDLQTGLVDRSGTLLALPGTDAAIHFRRPAVLPKGQRRRLQMRFFAPAFPGDEDATKALNTLFQSRGGRVAFDTGNEPFSVMEAQEYFFLVFTSRPETFLGLQAADFTLLPNDNFVFDDLSNRIRHYRVAIPSEADLVSLAESMFGWTSTAYLFWDDASPLRITTEQQNAILDWLHFGGRIIINGPSRQDWGDSFLGPYLPLQDPASAEIDSSDLVSMIEQWTVPADPSAEQITSALQSREGVPGVDGPLHAAAHAVRGTAGMVVQRQVGRGAVTMTRFDLGEEWLRKWNSMQSFYNGALMLRPPRTYRSDDDEISEFTFSQLVWAPPLTGKETDPTLNTGFAMAARDGGLADSVADIVRRPNANSAYSQYLDWGLMGSALGGRGAWNDFSGIAIAARDSLRSASGISVPKNAFVMRSLAWYLLALIPVNFLIFRLIGRIEWAWIGVPLIAVVGAVWVARNAQLDIGFARSRNELAVLELQPNHARGPLVRYLSLYNSLSTNYVARFASAEACGAPLAQRDEVIAREASRQLEMRFGYDDGAELHGFGVPSNRTDMLHIEEMFDAGGTLQLSPAGDALYNGTTLRLEHVLIDHNDPDEGYRVALVGPLEPGATVPLRFQADTVEPPLPESEISLVALTRACRTAMHLRPGEMRLVGHVAESLPGTEITPVASQTHSHTVVLAHLAHASFGPVSPDLMLRPGRQTPTVSDTELGQDGEPITPDEPTTDQ